MDAQQADVTSPSELPQPTYLDYLRWKEVKIAVKVLQVGESEQHQIATTENFRAEIERLLLPYGGTFQDCLLRVLPASRPVTLTPHGVASNT